MFKYLISLILLSLLFTGCATKSQERVKFENDKLMHDLYTLKICRELSSEKLDDGVSSAEIIALAVIKDCSKEAKHVMDTNMLDSSEEHRKNFENQMNDVKTSGVLSIILEYRSKK